jgi:hypothetical protein
MVEQTTSKTRRDLTQFHCPTVLKPAWLHFVTQGNGVFFDFLPVSVGFFIYDIHKGVLK